MNKLILENVKKTYGKKTALDSCSVSFQTGITALLGPNGAGKTTMMNIIADLISKDSGRVLWNGEDIGKLGIKYREILGFMPQNVSLYKRFTAADNLRYLGRLKGMNREQVEHDIPELLKKVNLSDSANKKFGSFSGGMKQRLGIAAAIMNGPKLLILDEPTAGLDPKERIHFRNIIEELSKDSVIILSTHIVSDIEMLADDIVLIKDGKVCEKGSTEELVKKYPCDNDEDRSSLEAVYMRFFGENET